MCTAHQRVLIHLLQRHGIHARPASNAMSMVILDDGVRLANVAAVMIYLGYACHDCVNHRADSRAAVPLSSGIAS